MGIVMKLNQAAISCFCIAKSAACLMIFSAHISHGDIFQLLSIYHQNLPEDELYFPPILIRVKDNRRFGSRPTVGQYIIKKVQKYQTQPLTKPSKK